MEQYNGESVKDEAKPSGSQSEPLQANPEPAVPADADTAPADEKTKAPEPDKNADNSHPASKSSRRRRRRRRKNAHRAAAAAEANQPAGSGQPAESAAPDKEPEQQPEQQDEKTGPDLKPDTADAAAQPQTPEPEKETAPEEKPQPEEEKPAACNTPSASPLLPARPETPPAWPVQQDAAGPDNTDSAPEEDSSEETEEQPDAAQQARVAEMSRTVQMSIEQIMAGTADHDGASSSDDQTSEEEPSEQDDAEEPDVPQSLGQRISGWLLQLAASLLKWVILVAVFIAIIAGMGLAWLYQKATPDQIPQIQVSFAGQTLETASYSWKVPVVGNQIKRTYSDTVTEEPSLLPTTVETAHPSLQVTPDGYVADIQIWDEGGVELFAGSLIGYQSFDFSENGTYTAQITVGTDQGGSQNATVTGSQTYHIQFTVGLRPSIRLSNRSVQQGSIVAVHVDDTQSGEKPVLKSKLGSVTFVEQDGGWVAYLPIPVDQDPGGYVVTVEADGYSEQLDLAVDQADFGYRDVRSNSSRITPYIGPDDTPQEVQELLDIADDEIYWAEDGFVQPSLRSLGVVNAYGEAEYVGRNSQERTANIDNGTARIAENTLVETKRGDDLICPADGRVLLAEKLDGTAGNTIVIEHGAGVKSIFYCLNDIAVEAGDTVRQGETLGTTKDRTILEVRVGQVAVDPLTVLRNQSAALRS